MGSNVTKQDVDDIARNRAPKVYTAEQVEDRLAPITRRLSEVEGRTAFMKEQMMDLVGNKQPAHTRADHIPDATKMVIGLPPLPPMFIPPQTTRFVTLTKTNVAVADCQSNAALVRIAVSAIVAIYRPENVGYTIVETVDGHSHYVAEKPETILNQIVEVMK